MGGLPFPEVALRRKRPFARKGKQALYDKTFWKETKMIVIQLASLDEYMKATTELSIHDMAGVCPTDSNLHNEAPELD